MAVWGAFQDEFPAWDNLLTPDEAEDIITRSFQSPGRSSGQSQDYSPERSRLSDRWSPGSHPSPFASPVRRARESPSPLFRPKINEWPLPLASFEERNQLWTRQRSLREDQLQRKKAVKEMVECSFRPQTNESIVMEEKLNSELLRESVDRLGTVKPSRAVAREAAAREAAIEAECTFAPRLLAKHPEPTSRARPRPAPSGPSCTFQPKINPVGKKMPAARQYLTENVFERLSTVIAETDPEESAVLPDDEAHAVFLEFLSRQNYADEVRRHRLEKLAKSADTVREPALCPRSRKLAASGGKKFGFEPRERSRKPAEVEPEPSYRPEITKAARLRPARSAQELSTGDAKRRETNLQKIRQRLVMHNRQQEPFAPEVRSSNPAAVGRIGSAAAVEEYIARMRVRDERLAQKLERLRSQQEAEEMNDCTFTPAVAGVPEYIVRMAEASRARKNVGPKTAPPKPDWR